jgi:hypothetical protein
MQLLRKDKNTGSKVEGLTVKHASKWGGLCERVVKLQDGESIVLECDGDAAEEAHKIRNGLNGIAACILVRRSVTVVDGKDRDYARGNPADAGRVLKSLVGLSRLE